MPETGADASPKHRITPPRAARNVLLNWVAFAFSVGVSFFLSPYIVHTLGNTAYGIWVLLASLVGYMGLLDLGVRSAVMRYVARHHARLEDEEAGRAASAGLLIFAAAGLLAFICSVVIAALLDRLFRIPADAVPVARVVVLVGGLGVAVALVNGVFGGIVAAMQRFDLSGLTDVLVGGLRAVAIVAALHAGWGLLGLALAQLGASLLHLSIQYALSRKLYPQLRLRLGNVDRGEVRKIFSFGLFSSLLHLSSALIFSADSVVIGAFLPVATITFFAISATLTDYTRSIIASIAQTITPRASALDGVGAIAELQRILLKTAALATLVVLPITITFVLRGRAFIGLWMGPSYAEPSGRVLVILSVALAFAAARQVVMSASIGMNRHRQLGPFYVVEGLLNVGLSVYWIRTLGIDGVALGTAVPNLATTLLVIPWMVHRLTGTRVREVWLGVWLRPLAAMLPFAAATYAIEHFWPAHGLATFFAGVVAALPIAAAGAWFVAISREDRQAYARALRNALTPIFGRPVPR